MEEFLKQYYALITYGVELLAAVIGLFCLKKYKTTAAKYFIYFLVYAFFVDLLGGYPRFLRTFNLSYLIENSVIKANYWWFTIFWNIGAVLFYSFLFRKIISKEISNKVIKYSTFVFLLFSICSIALNYNSFFNESLRIINVFGTIIILMSVILYFIEMLKSESVLNFYKSLYFYIGAVIFIWWLIITPIVFYEIYFSTSDWNFVFLKWQIFLFANVFMYLTFTFALIYCKPELKND
ncbi:hypothetical protein GCM10011531_16520 [Aquaticitalea lipolytica]|uniref:Uncharacterized protein n=1 Tax=Aquaticitalea lipolytica TaxID=1247562 RepID=A0A8J2XH03_9FLAO|nr:hypothetical protein [Aquaticitalea lipolytica]GFZ85924.1 hypothetical protein GCM10011531_16520 [Aquaticitalea lipolytica]